MKNLIIAFVLILLIAIGFFVFLPKDNQEIANVENNITEEINTENNIDLNTDLNTDLNSEVVKEETNPNSVNNVVESKIKGSYEIYDPSKISLAKNNDVILFFHASWCPSCRSLDKDINQNLNNIPEGVLIMKVDYDKERDLKKKYGVTYQHTLVQVDENGNMISKWSGSDDLIEILNKIK